MPGLKSKVQIVPKERTNLYLSYSLTMFYLFLGERLGTPIR